jgi:Tetratricopeptide repeat
VAIGQVHLPEQRATAGQPVRLAPRPPVLAGREALLAALDARLAAGDGAAPRTVVLCGLGGAGKTSVAVEYACRHLAEAGVAWQFPAEDATVLAAGFGELAAQLGARGLADPRDPVTSVHAVLARFPAPWLLIFDNAADMASVGAFLPPAGPGRVLITSQNPNWPGPVLDVPVLDPDVAADFLVSRTGDPDRQAGRDLADVLGGLPLALEQAAAYLRAIGVSLAGYLALFRQRRAGLLARGELTGYSKTVASTWALAFERLQQTEPGAVGLLRLLAFCAPEAVPLRLLLHSRPGRTRRLGDQVALVLMPLIEDPLAAGDAIGALRRYSLVTPAADGSVSVHRLIQAVTADQMPADLVRQWRRATAALVEAALPAEPWMSGTWPVYAMLLPHAQAALPDDSDGMARLATYLGSSGSYATARDLQRRILDARETVLGPQHPDTLAARHELGRWTGEAGGLAAARDLFAELLPVREQVLGPQHPDTLTTRHELAHYAGMAGDIAAARDLFAGLLPVREQVLGPEHPDTLTTRHEFAHLIGEAGDPAAARDLFARLLPVCERVSGAQHPWTLGARHELGRWTGHAGDPAAARDLFAGLVSDESDEQVLGAQHPDTLGARHELAIWTGEAGDPAAARDLFAGLLPVRERVSGPQHPYTLTARYELGRWTGEAGDPAAARDLFAGLLPALEQVLGPQHPYTLNARANLARWTGEAGDPAAVRGLFAGLLLALEQVFGPQHPDTLAARAILARWTGTADSGPGVK